MNICCFLVLLIDLNILDLIAIIGLFIFLALIIPIGLAILTNVTFPGSILLCFGLIISILGMRNAVIIISIPIVLFVILLCFSLLFVLLCGWMVLIPFLRILFCCIVCCIVPIFVIVSLCIGVPILGVIGVIFGSIPMILGIILMALSVVAGIILELINGPILAIILGCFLTCCCIITVVLAIILGCFLTNCSPIIFMAITYEKKRGYLKRNNF